MVAAFRIGARCPSLGPGVVEYTSAVWCRSREKSFGWGAGLNG
jgi:hypothetical protein